MKLRVNRKSATIHWLWVTTLLVVGLVAAARSAYAAVWEACGQWDSWSNGGYNLYNNIWGSGAGTQCIWANSYSNWGVNADHPDTGGVKSYPNSELPDINTRISDLSSLTSSFDSTVPAAGSYSTTYDIWSGRRYEIMLWMNYRGAVGPWAGIYDDQGNPIPNVENVTVGGHSWDAYYNGGVQGRHVISLLRTSNTYAGTVDILAVLQWIQSQGWIGNISIEKVQLGFEITSSPGGLDFTMNSYSVSYGTSSTAAPAAPTGLLATPADATSVDLSWTDQSNNEDGFEIERSLSSGTGFTWLTSVGANVASYTDPTLTTGTTYYYRVRAYNSGGYSAYSNEASAAPQQLGTGTGLFANYYDDADLINLVLSRTDPQVSFDWGSGSPDPAIGVDSFSVRWTGFVQPFYSETYTFRTLSDDGDRVWVDGTLIIDDWRIQRGNKSHSGSIALQAGVKHSIVVEFFENSGGAKMQLYWSSPSQGEQLIPQSQLYVQ